MIWMMTTLDQSIVLSVDDDLPEEDEYSILEEDDNE